MASPAIDLPSVEYARRSAARRAAAETLARRERRVSYARLAVFVAGLVVVWLWAGLRACSAAWLGVPLGVFVALVVVHLRLRAARRRAERAAAFYARGLARLEDRWQGGGEAGLRFVDESHPYAEDLDLFGRGSLFEFLCTVRTRAGEDTLAAWLCAPALVAEIRARQAAAGELRDRLDLREDLAVLGTDVRAGLDPDVLVAWGGAPARLPVRGVRIAAGVLAGVAIAALAGWVAGVSGPLPLLVGLAVEGCFALALRHRVLGVIRAVDRPARELALLGHLLSRLEREPFSTPRLRALRSALDTGGVPPSRCIASLRRRVDLLYARNNELFAPIAALVMWATQGALAIEAWRVAHGAAIAQWLAAVGEIETLCALAGYAYEHPADPFPEFVEQSAWFEADGIAHPLLAETRCVRNDVRLGGELRVLMVSGSNMSGKSTLLRTVGTNAVLALMGAPVRAHRLRLSPLTVGASVRLHDSLQAGTSRFYAEITRLHQLANLASGPRPLLFLLDEILHGTNSHDRRIGAEAIVRGLIERGAIGLVTTHDLALTDISEALGARGANVHFEDRIEDGRMTFDYRMRPGVVARSNALALMRTIGFDV